MVRVETCDRVAGSIVRSCEESKWKTFSYDGVNE